ncbi:unnamed protein product (macronuclear) [Paramecium tetraurelia]|uniref:Transmembrane protein n=1 Tax=Paramecium tetraurelia TaxID=5888 RepID=A0DVG4_PARTE|nr:uncharacterized protein GSPATT00039795001 [Paramecium tetraurelia]CAK87031.1 unnamed protein product [Paramecium tetraurelia]|eukprot:XP_001454428.1 hypothetical protein (macronuclear) [Paramecium tetraurelia strain d4-2]
MQNIHRIEKKYEYQNIIILIIYQRIIKDCVFMKYQIIQLIESIIKVLQHQFKNICKMLQITFIFIYLFKLILRISFVEINNLLFKVC